MTKTQQQYLYDIENRIGCQLQENQKLKIQNNIQTDSKKISQIDKFELKIKESCINQLEKQIARKKLGLASQFDPWYSYNVKNNHNHYIYHQRSYT